MISVKKDFFFENVKEIKGIGNKLAYYLKNKKIEKIKDVIFDLPYAETDRSKISRLDRLEIGKIQTVKIMVKKLNFPRIRNLPNRIICEDGNGKIEIVYFNSREGYLRKLYPINQWVIVSGKINYYNKKYQVTNPDYVTSLNNQEYILKNIPKYNLTKGITEKKYRLICENILKKMPRIDDWLDDSFIKKNKLLNWNETIYKLHNTNDSQNYQSPSYRRLAFDEIFANFLVLSKNRKKVKKLKKNKNFKQKLEKKILTKLPFQLTKSQKKVLDDINDDLKSETRMFRILQGDVGSGKTIVSMLAIANTIEDKYQSALMAPTEILTLQHYKFALKIFNGTNVKIEYLSGKTEKSEKKRILKELSDGKIDLLFGTHAIFQKKVKFKKLGLIIIDEQHKFGVRQRADFAEKGGKNCDVLLMSATPIPRTMMMALYGDMDVSKITEKPLNRKDIITISKPEKKINELWPFIKNQIDKGNQVFWVCPLIKDSSHLDYSSVKNKFEIINKRYPQKVGLIHGALKKDDKEIILKKFLNKDISILVSTTVIEVGVDFPNASLIIIENANKYGLAQLHQLRGRVGRGNKQSTCILLFKDSLSKNAIKRIKILKNSDDGFYIAEQDLNIRGFGDLIGFQQSGIKNFRFADPIHHKELFQLAEIFINKIYKNINDTKYSFLLKMFDKAEIINLED